MLTLIVSACGKRPQVVTGIQVQSSVVNEDVMLALKADLDLGSMMFPSVTLPILHPRGQTQLGSVELLPVLGGKNQIKISVNVSSLADIRASQASLPNGNAVPLIANNPTITVNLGKGAKLYLTIGANAVALGVAVPISTFDGIGNAVGWVADNINWILPLLAGMLAGFIAFKVVSTVITIFGLLKTIIGGASSVMAIFNAVMAANPAVLIALAIGVLIGVIMLLWNNWDKVAKWLGNSFKGLGNIFIGLVNIVINGINTMIAAFLSPFNLLIKGFNATVGKITGKIPEIRIAIPKIPKLESGGIAFGNT